MASPSTGPLAGIRIIDLTINVLGPLATQTLGDMGAEIIKVEPPGGDPMRQTGPARSRGMSVFFMNMNRNKKSIVLDLKQASDARTLHELVAAADVFVHSMRTKAIARLGFGYAALKARNPGLIYASAPGYSPEGPYRDRPAYDDVIQGQSGIGDMMDRMTGTPAYFPTVMADKFCGISLASAIGMALFARERSGVGQEVAVPMLETMLAFNLVEHLWSGVHAAGGPLGYTRALSPHRRPYATRDGYICMLAQNDEHWRRFFHLCGRPGDADNPKFSSLAARTENIDELYTVVSEQIETRTTGEWQSLLDANDIPNAPMARLDELPADPYLRQTGFFSEYDHPSEGRLLRTAIPQRFSATPPSFRLPPPALGQHTDEVLNLLQEGARP